MNLKSIIGKGITLIVSVTFAVAGSTSCRAYDYFSYTNTEGGKNHEEIEAGPLVEHRFDVSSDFSAIESESFIDIVFIQSSNPADFGVKGLIPDNFIDKMDVKVKNGTLVISEKKGYYSLRFKHKPKQFPVIYVTGKTLSSVRLTGSGDFSVKGDLTVTGNDFKVNINGSGDFSANGIYALNANSVFSVNGSGDIEVKTLESNQLKLNIAGSGDAEFKQIASATSEFTIAGSGDIKVGGKTENVFFSIAGSGEIMARGLKAHYGKAHVSGSGELKCSVQNLTQITNGSGEIHNRP